MSNTSIVTKLLTLVKGAFGRKETASGAVQEPRAEGEGRTAENGGGEQKISTATTERTEQAAPAERAAPSVVVDEDTAAAETPEEEPAPSPEAEKPEPAETPAPATDDVPEKDAAIAKELDTNENHTEVASDEVLERVRKGAAPSAEELAVPTYDELTLPSIRARLRKLTIDQVRDLRSYEVAHQSRPEFVKMYDNRIAKLQAEEG